MTLTIEEEINAYLPLGAMVIKLLAAGRFMGFSLIEREGRSTTATVSQKPEMSAYFPLGAIAAGPNG